MSLITNVVRRGGSYYFRVRVPRRLVARVGRHELWRTLGTAEASVARAKAGRLMTLTESLWSALDAAMSPEQVQQLIDEWLEQNLSDDATARSGLSRRPHKWAITKGSGSNIEFVRPLRADEIPDPKDYPGGITPLPDVGLGPGEAFRWDVSQSFAHDQRQWLRLGSADEHLRKRDISLVENEVMSLLAERGLHLNPESDEFFDACLAMLKARATLWAEVRERAETNWRPHRASSQGILHPTEVNPVPSARTGLTLSVAAKAFVPHVSRTDQLKPKRTRDYEVGIRSFIDWLGEDPDLADVTPTQAGAFMNALSFYPANGSKRPAYRDLDFRGRVALATESGEEAVLNPVTIMGKYLTPLRRMFEWYRQSGHAGAIEVNPFAGIKPSKPRRKTAENKRRTFTDVEVARWLSEPLFLGSKTPSQAGLYQSGDVRVGDWHYWLPLMSLFTGARPSELLQLALVDVKEAEGIPYFSIRDLSDDQSVKTGEWRQVPIHRHLISLGFLKLVNSRRVRGEERLFDIEPGAGGYLSDIPSKFFNRMIRRIADPNPDKAGALVLYSVRHTVISKLRAAGTRQDESMALVGHEGGDSNTVHAGYGDHSMVRLREVIDKIDYANVDWSKLRLPTEVLEGKRPY